MTDINFAKQLLQLRKKKGVTQEQLASVIGVSSQAVSKWENGSYPEGDLLPRIADYFGVSIDYLYGRAQDEISIEQQIMNELEKVSFGSDNDKGGYFSKMKDLLWAMQIAAWGGNDTFYSKSKVDEETGSIVSCTASDNGFTYWRLNESQEYYVFMTEPENGFQSYFQASKELANFFKELGDLDNLRIVMEMMKMASGDCVSPDIIAKRLGISTQKVTDTLERLFHCISQINGTAILRKMNQVTENGKKPLYYINQNVAYAIFVLLAGADMIMNPPMGYNMQIYNRTKPWICDKNEKNKKENKMS